MYEKLKAPSDNLSTGFYWILKKQQQQKTDNSSV